LLAIPMWHDSVAGKFLLEPAKTAVVHARVPGTVADVDVKEGQQVAAGEPLAKLVNLPLASAYDAAQARLMTASHHAALASLKYADYGVALKEREESVAVLEQVGKKRATLDVASPISGTVLTPKVGEILGTTLKTGDAIMEVADLSTLRARIYVSEWEMNRVRSGADATIQVGGFFRGWKAKTSGISNEPVAMPEGLGAENNLNGTNQLKYYVVDLTVANTDEKLRPGMSGLARIYVGHRSLAGMGWEGMRNFWGRKLW